MIDEVIIYDWIKELVLKRGIPQKEPDVIFVSEIARCLRRSYYSRIYGVKESAANLIPTLLDMLLHEELQKHLKEKYGWDYGVRREYSVDNEFKLVGRADLVGKDAVIEIEITQYAPDFILPFHEYQLTANMKLYNRIKGIIIYIARNGHVKTFSMHFEPELWSAVVRRAKTLYKALKLKYAPQIEFSPWCFHCPFRRRCFRG